MPLNAAEAESMVISTKQKERCLAKNNKELSLTIQEHRVDNDNFPTAKYLGIQMNSYRIGKFISKLYQQR